jgi:hypothetical protein
MLTLLEIAKSVIMIYFSVMEQMGKTQEEMDEFFKAQYARFKQNRPENLPDA